MTLSVNLKTKPAAWDGGPVPTGITVMVNHNVLTPKDRTQLSRLGLNRVDTAEFDRECWSLPAGAGPKPLYLIYRLKESFGSIRIKPELQEMLQKATTGRDKNPNYQKKTYDTTGGMRDLSVVKIKNLYVANCDITDTNRREFLEGAGFLPYTGKEGKIFAHMGSRPYAAGDVMIAANLKPFFTPKTQEAFSADVAKAAARVALSKRTEAPADFDIPAPKNLDYLDFQKVGIQHAVRTGENTLVADEMGLGKTITAIGTINGRNRDERILIMCEANMKVTWREELTQWLLRPRSIGIAYGDDFPDTDVVIINYDLAARHEQKIRAIQWGMQIFDEGHRLTNPKAKRTIAAFGDVVAEDPADDPGSIPLTPDGQILILTGTPQRNRVEEMFPILSTIRPEVWGRGAEAFRIFADKYAPAYFKKNEKSGGIIRIPGKVERYPDELQMRLRSTTMIRRPKSSTNLPPKIRQAFYIDIPMTEEDREMLKRAEADLQAIRSRHVSPEIHQSDKALAGAVIELVEDIHSESEEFHTIARIRKNIGLLKAPYAAQFLIEEMQGLDEDGGEVQKTIVFAHHAEVIDILAAKLREVYPDGVLVYDGRTSTKAREEARHRFQNDDKARFFIGSSAAHTGITLTRSSRVRTVEPDWSPSGMVQSEDRAWRIGQQNAVSVGYFLIPNTLDAAIGRELIRKTRNIDLNLNVNNQPLGPDGRRERAPDLINETARTIAFKAPEDPNPSAEEAPTSEQNSAGPEAITADMADQVPQAPEAQPTEALEQEQETPEAQISAVNRLEPMQAPETPVTADPAPVAQAATEEQVPEVASTPEAGPPEAEGISGESQTVSKDADTPEAEPQEAPTLPATAASIEIAPEMNAMLDDMAALMVRTESPEMAFEAPVDPVASESVAEQNDPVPPQTLDAVTDFELPVSDAVNEVNAEPLPEGETESLDLGGQEENHDQGVSASDIEASSDAEEVHVTPDTSVAEGAPPAESVTAEQIKEDPEPGEADVTEEASALSSSVESEETATASDIEATETGLADRDEAPVADVSGAEVAAAEAANPVTQEIDHDPAPLDPPKADSSPAPQVAADPAPARDATTEAATEVTPEATPQTATTDAEPLTFTSKRRSGPPSASIFAPPVAPPVAPVVTHPAEPEVEAVEATKPPQDEVDANKRSPKTVSKPKKKEEPSLQLSLF